MTNNIIEPTVIDEDLLLKAVNEQASGDAAEIARKEGIDFLEVISLRLDYKNILKIDHLWQFESLTKLQLDNNIIEKIENISHLKNLIWLDLSFNNISVIEGLEGLMKLTDLSLFNNRINKMENMDSLTQLNVLSIGNNCIDEMQQLSYLSRFDRLRLLNASGNPICRDPEYKNFVLSRLRNIKYLDYRLIEQAAINAAREIYIDDIIAIEEEQKIVAKQTEEREAQAQLLAKYADAYLPGIERFTETLFAADPDYQKLLLFARETLVELQAQFRERCEPVVSEFAQTVFAQQGARREEWRQYRLCVRQSVERADGEGQALLRAFQSQKKAPLRQLTLRHEGADDALARMRALVGTLCDELLGMELVLVEQFEELNKEFERNYTDLANAVREHASACFAKLRELENENHEKINEAVLVAFERQSKTDMEDLDDVLRDLLRDKDAVSNHITGSHDYRMSKVDSQEEVFISGITDELEKIINKVHYDELKRDRRRVKEIILFNERCFQEFEMAEEMGA